MPYMQRFWVDVTGFRSPHSLGFGINLIVEGVLLAVLLSSFLLFSSESRLYSSARRVNRAALRPADSREPLVTI